MTTTVQDQRPKIPDGFHAFMLADVLIRDPGQGHILEVTFNDGRKYRARASAEVLRLGSRLSGQVRATLHFRTDTEAALQEPLHLYRVRPIATPLNPPNGTFWAASGLVAADPHALVILPEKARTLPFKIYYQPQRDNAVLYPARASLVVAGLVVAGQLISTESRVCAPMEIPARWQVWERWL